MGSSAEPLPHWLDLSGDGAATLTLHVQPGARVTEVVGCHGDALKLRLAAPPVEGRANACLVAFLAERLGVARADVVIVAGTGGRRKRVRVAGADAERLRALADRSA